VEAARRGSLINQTAGGLVPPAPSQASSGGQAMKSYELMVRVNAANLTTVIEVLKNAAEIVNLKQVEIQAAPDKTSRRMVNGGQIRERGKRADQVIMELVNPGAEYSVDTIGEMIAARGFSANSAHPAISVLVKAGKIVRTRPGFCRSASIE
jgi:hypothetical protein